MHQGRRGDVLVLDVGTQRTNKAQKVESSVLLRGREETQNPSLFIYLVVHVVHVSYCLTNISPLSVQPSALYVFYFDDETTEVEH